MLKLALILMCVSLSFAKIAKKQLKLFEENDYKSLEIVKEIESKKYIESNVTLWVLNLLDDSLDFRRLYLGNKDEVKVFKNIIRPAINNFKLQNSKTTKVDYKQPVNENSQINFKTNIMKDIKNDILVLMNKFYMNQVSDPDSYLSESLPRNEQKSLKLYFIGPFTSLIMTSNKMRYHYFINPPSPLPSWFYKEHKNIMSDDNKKYVEIPIGVQHDFLYKLLNILKLYVGYPA